MKRIIVAVLIAAAAALAPASAQASWTSENDCTTLMYKPNTQSTAAFYNDARYGGGYHVAWAWNAEYGRYQYGHVSAAVNWVSRVSDREVLCRVSLYGIPYYSGYGVGNRCQFYGRAYDGQLVYSKFEQCYGFDVWW